LLSKGILVEKLATGGLELIFIFSVSTSTLPDQSFIFKEILYCHLSLKEYINTLPTLVAIFISFLVSITSQE